MAWDVIHSWTEAVDAIDFASASTGWAATHPFPAPQKGATGMWDEEKTAVGKLWTTSDGGFQWQLRHEAQGRIVLVQSLAEGVMAVREVYTEGKAPPLRHQLEFLNPDHELRVLGTIPALVREICFVSPAQGYVCSSRDMYWTANGGGDWRKVGQRTAEPFTGKLESVAGDASIYFVRAGQLVRYAPATGMESPLSIVPGIHIEAVGVDRKRDAAVVAGKLRGEWVCVSVSGGRPGEIQQITGGRAEAMGHVLHADGGDITLITISTGTFLPSYASYLYRKGGWQREDTGDARNFGALAFAGGRAWVARRPSAEAATRLYCRK